MSINEKMYTARALIQFKQYDKARAILLTVDHTKAREWLRKLDVISVPVKQKVDRPTYIVLLIIALILIIGGGVLIIHQQTARQAAGLHEIIDRPESYDLTHGAETRMAQIDTPQPSGVKK
jgi:hypothetical protein